MVKVNEAFEVKYRHSGGQFEVLVDFNKLKEFKEKPNQISVYDVLADTKIFRDQKKGELASNNLLKQVFPNKSNEEILKEILLKGECQIPTAYINELREEKKKQAINYISENAINPSTKTKYTQTMIESQVNKIKYNFSPERDYITQANEILAHLKKTMPIAITKIIIKIKVSGMYCGNFYGPFRRYGNITKEFFDDKGNMHIHIEINESIADEVINYIKNKSNNEAEYYITQL